MYDTAVHVVMSLLAWCREEAWACFYRILGTLGELHEDPGAWLSTWFKGAPVHSIRRDNVAEMLAAAIWSSSRCVALAGCWVTGWMVA